MASAVLHAVHWAIIASAGVAVLAMLCAPLAGAGDISELRNAATRGTLLELATRRASARVNRAAPHRALVAAAVMGSMGAAGVHAAVTRPHFAESMLLGAFFLAVSTAQAGWAVAVLRQPRRSAVRAGLVGNGAVIAMWLLTRTVPLTGGVEPVGIPDLVATACELISVLACALSLARPGRAVVSSWA